MPEPDSPRHHSGRGEAATAPDCPVCHRSQTLRPKFAAVTVPVPSPNPAAISQRCDRVLQGTGTASAEQHWMDGESIVIKLAEVKTSSRHRRVLLTREEIELA